MARLPRVCPVDIPQHVIQRGNNRQICFACDADFAAYVHWLKEHARAHGVELHAWVLMTNHVHLLCTPKQPNAVSAMMQALGRQYVRYFNSAYQRTGTLWEGRFKSCLVQTESYLLELYRYIELNPVRAGMVAHPADYHWSSYQINAVGHRSDVCTPHAMYLALGHDANERQTRYRALFETPMQVESLQRIRESLNKGAAFGSDKFKAEIELMTGRRMTAGRVGRPTKSANDAPKNARVLL